MANNKYLNDVGLKYFYERLKLVLAGKQEFNNLKTKVDNMIEQGGEPNTIDYIAVNGTRVTPDSNKQVDLTIPVKTSDLTNDGDGTSIFATATALDGKVDKEAGKGLSTNDYSTTDKGKVDKLVWNGSVLDSSVLPSFVDDVVEVYPVGATELASNWLSTTAGGAPITPESGRIYVLMADSTNYTANSQFRFGGTTYVKLSDGGVSSITTAEIDTIIAGE